MQPKRSSKVVSTKLKLKGKPVDIHKIMKKVKRPHPEDAPIQVLEESPEVRDEEIKEEMVIQPIEEGTGKIMSSLTTVHGKDTEFSSELESGDKLIIYNEDTKEDEERVISMVLGNKSLGLKEPFTRDISKFTDFKYQKKPVVKQRERPIDELVNEEMTKISKGLGEESLKPKTVIEYRANAGPWTYKKVTQEVDGALTREEQLDIRVKKTRDKFCWC